MNVRAGDEVFVLNGVSYNFELAAGGALGFASDSPFAPKSTSGERSYADYDPFSAVAFTDLSGGMGQERATDVTKYYDAANVDARGGRLILGPLVHYNSATLPGLDTHSDALLQGTNTTGTLTFYGGIGGTSCSKVAAKLIIPAGFTEIDRFWLPLKGYALAGTITVKIYNDSSGAPGTEIATTTLSRDELQPFGSWAQASFSPAVTVSAGGTYWISVEHAGAIDVLYWYGGYSTSTAYSVNENHVYWDGAAWLTDAGQYWHLIVMYDDPTARPDSSLRYVLGAGEDGITRLWGYSGRRLYYIGSNSLPVAVQDGAGNSYEAAAEILHAVWFRAVADGHPYLYCALGDATSYVKFDGNIGTEQWATITMTGSGVSQGARRLAVHDNLLWRADEVCNVSASLDGTAYGGTVAVGDKTYPIRNMLSWNGALYVGKDDGLYKVEYATGYPTSGAPTVTKVLDFGSMANSVNFAAMCEHQGDLVFSLERGMIRFTAGNVVTPISPDTGLNLSADERAVYRAAHSSLNVLWVCAEGSLSGKSSLMALIDWHWHPIVTVPRAGDMMRSVHVEPGLYGQYPRVWFKAGLQVAYVNMPTTTQKRWLWGTGMDYAATGTIDLPWVDGNIRTINKDWVQVELDVSGVSRSWSSHLGYQNVSWVDVYYRTAEDAAWVQLGASIYTEGITTLAFPINTYGGKVQLRIALSQVEAASAVTPQVEAVVLKYMERPMDAVSFTRTYILKARSPNRAGATGVKSLAQWVTILQTLRESAEPLTFYPFWGVDAGVSYNVHIANYTVSEVRSEVGVSAAASMIATLKLNQVK